MYSGNFELKTIRKANNLLRLRAQGMSLKEIGELVNMHWKAVSDLVCAIKRYPVLIDPEVAQMLKKGGEK